MTEVRSPDSRKRAVVFERDCGATTDFSTQVSILNGNELLSREAGNIFIADSNHGTVQKMLVTVRWDSTSRLVVSYPTRARVFLQRDRGGDVAVSYEKTLAE